MKKSIEILKVHQAWRTHQCDSDGIEGCWNDECNMPITTPSELTDAIDDVIKYAERYEKVRILKLGGLTELYGRSIGGDGTFDELVDAI